MPLSCSQSDCIYATEDVAENLAEMLELLRLHTMACHTTTTSAGTPTRQAQAERVKRPILSLSGKMLDPEEYEHFVYTYSQFKDRLGDDQDGATLLSECLVTDVSRILYSNFGAAIGSFTEEQILTKIHQELPSSDHSPSLRRSERSARGQTSQYDDFVQNIFLFCPPFQYDHYKYTPMRTNQWM